MKKNMKKLLMTCLTIVSILCIATISYAEDNDADALKEQISSIESEIEQLESEKADLQAQVDELEGTGDDTDTEGGGNVEIVAEYTDKGGSHSHHLIIVKNNTDEDVKVSSESFAYDEDGSMIAYGDGYLDVLGSGCTSIITESIDTEEDIAYFDTTINSSSSGNYVSVIQDLSYVENDISGGAIFQVTNNGDYAAEFVKGYALFFLNGELVDYDYSYFTDDDGEIKPGNTASDQITTYEDYDSIEFYLDGERYAG